MGQYVTLKGLDTLRKVASNGYVPGNTSNNKIVGEIIDRIDDAVGSSAAGDVLGGNAQGGADTQREARDMWSRLQARSRDALRGHGRPPRCLHRQRRQRRQRDAAEHAANPREAARLLADEQGALRTAVEGTPVQNALRKARSFAPTGAVALPAISQGAKWLADTGTELNVQDLIAVIMRGGQRAPLPPTQNAILGSRDALARGAIGAAANGQTGPRDDAIKRAVMRSAGRQ